MLALVTRSEFGLIVALAACYLMYFVFRRTDELGRHAAQNTAATLVVCGANVVAGFLFLDEVNAFAQSVYVWFRVPALPADTWEGVPLWLVCILAIATRDFADYWNHRLMHTRWGWPAHAAHHTDTYVNAFTGYRVHFLESIVMSLSYIVLLTWLQMPQAIPFVIVFYAVHNKYVHMNLVIDHGPFRLLVASPMFHRWHHADTPEAYGKNLANVMPVYDRLFGTYYMPGPCTAPMGALAAGLADKNPLAIYVYPFREWGRLIRQSFGGRARRRIPAE